MNYSLIRTINTITDNWALKAGLSILVTLEYHAGIFGLFCLLVFLDLLTRWFAISHKMLIDDGKEGTLIDSLKGIPEAHRRRLINSCTMRKAFASKALMYIILTFAGAIVDQSMIAVHHQITAVPLVISYLTMTELLSMVENLDEAGISAMHDLISLIKGRRK